MFVVLGATGKIGQATVRALRAGGVNVRAVVRDSSRAGLLEELGCEVVVADLVSPRHKSRPQSVARRRCK